MAAYLSVQWFFSNKRGAMQTEEAKAEDRLDDLLTGSLGLSAEVHHFETMLAPEFPDRSFEIRAFGRVYEDVVPEQLREVWFAGAIAAVEARDDDEWVSLERHPAFEDVRDKLERRTRDVLEFDADDLANGLTAPRSIDGDDDLPSASEVLERATPDESVPIEARDPGSTMEIEEAELEGLIDDSHADDVVQLPSGEFEDEPTRVVELAPDSVSGRAQSKDMTQESGSAEDESSVVLSDEAEEPTAGRDEPTAEATADVTETGELVPLRTRTRAPGRATLSGMEAVHRQAENSPGFDVKPVKRRSPVSGLSVALGVALGAVITAAAITAIVWFAGGVGSVL
jgi:hypothetical protein